MSAIGMLDDAQKAIGNRAAERDKPSGERSMLAAVAAFNAMTGHELTEREGWLFMVMLKASRAQAGRFRADDYIDGAAYFALAGECAECERGDDLRMSAHLSRIDEE